MEIGFKSASYIINILSSIVNLIPIIKLKIIDDGLYINCIESNGCSIIILLISKKDIDIFKITEKKTLILDIKLLIDTLSKMDKLNPIKLIQKKSKDKLYISQKNINGRNSSCSMSLLSVDIQSMEIPEMEYGWKLTISSNELLKILEKLMLFSETCKISSDKNNNCIIFSSNSVFGYSKEEVPLNENNKIDDDVFNYFPLPYLIKFMKANKLSNNTYIYMTNEKPILLKYKFENSYLKFYLAPKIPDEIDEVILEEEE